MKRKSKWYNRKKIKHKRRHTGGTEEQQKGMTYRKQIAQWQK